MRTQRPDFSKTTLLFGGSFDPIHQGHIALVNGAREALPVIEQVVFVPCYESPGKAATIARPEERLRLLEVALSTTENLIWDFEALRPGPSYTVDTLREAQRLGATRDKLFLLLGADSYASFPSWRSTEEIRTLARLCVGNRPGHENASLHPDDSLFRITPSPLASHTIRESLSRGKVPKDTVPLALERELERLFLNSQNPYDN
jgi:nicotinate-nucleotide adenylyltransferase